MKRNGPRIMIKASCFDCEYEHSESYAVQGDSGHDVSCTHPDAPAKSDIGDTTWDTPSWCPLLAQALADKAKEQAS